MPLKRFPRFPLAFGIRHPSLARPRTASESGNLAVQVAGVGQFSSRAIAWRISGKTGTGRWDL